MLDWVMKHLSINLSRAKTAAVQAAAEAGAIIRRNQLVTKRASMATQHDIKLDLDVRCQKLIERRLRRAFPSIALLGEEGMAGNVEAEARWIVDPIDWHREFRLWHSACLCLHRLAAAGRRGAGCLGRRVRNRGGGGFRSVLRRTLDGGEGPAPRG